MTKQDLTETQAETLRVLITLTSNVGYSPTLREIAAVRGVQVAAVADCMRLLEAKGWIRREPGLPRTIRVLT